MSLSKSDHAFGVAAVGVGSAGRQHVTAIRDVDGLRLAAVVDVDPDAARRAATEFGSDVRALRLEEALSDPAVALVAVCTPPGDREDIVAAVVAAGRHLLVEKPPARDPGELARMVDAAESAGVAAGVMFQHRFALPPELRDGASDRFAGAVGSLLISRPRRSEHYESGSWRSESARALGGVTAHLGVHYLDLACQLLGAPRAVEPISRVDAVAGIDVQLCGHVSFESGAELSVTVTSRAAARVERLEILGRDDRFALVAGAVEAELDGRVVATAPRPAAALRSEVYRAMATAVAGRGSPGLAALRRSSGVVAVLDGLLAPAGVTR